MKYCPRCKQTLDLDSFYLRSDRKSQTHAYCKDCVNNQTKERQKALKIKAVEYKGGKCEDCCLSYPPACFDFHHRVPEEKDFAISKIKSLKWSQKIIDELDKCALLCANCHRIRHMMMARDSNLV